MNLLKTLLWAWRIRQTIPEVERLAEENAGDPLYRIRCTEDALSIFLEFSSQSENMGKTTEEDGEIIEVMFMRQWDRTHCNW